MDTRWLLTFVTIIRVGSFSAAAEERYLSQSTVSYQIAQLEREIGAKVLDRGTGQVEPTWAGQLLAPSADQALWSLNRVKLLIAHGPSCPGRLPGGRDLR